MVNKIIHNRFIRTVPIAALIFLIALLISCGRREMPHYSDNNNTETQSTVKWVSCPGKTIVKIQNQSFVPSAITIPAGSTVMWENYDQAIYSLVSSTVPENGSFSTPEIEPGYVYCLIFTEPGTFDYTVKPSIPAMQGTVIVSPAP